MAKVTYLRYLYAAGRVARYALAEVWLAPIGLVCAVASLYLVWEQCRGWDVGWGM